MPRVTIGLLMLTAAILLPQVLPVWTGESLAVGLQGHPVSNVGGSRTDSAISYQNAVWRIPSGSLGLRNVAAAGNEPTSAVLAQPEAVLGLQAVFSTYRDLADSLGIVVNRTNPVENLSFAELRKIFLGEQSHWSNGRRITVVMLEPGKQERQAVLTQIYRMDDKDFNKHFSQGMSSGEIHAVPKTLATSTEVLKFVFNVPGAIGYVRVTEADDSVKVVHVDSRLPGDKDYSIRLHPKSGKP